MLVLVRVPSVVVERVQVAINAMVHFVFRVRGLHVAMDNAMAKSIVGHALKIVHVHKENRVNRVHV